MPTLQIPVPADDGKVLSYNASLGKFVPTAIALAAVTPTGGGKETLVTANTGAAYTVNLAAGNAWDLTLNAATVTMAAFTGATNGVLCSIRVWIHQDGAGSRNLVWNANVKWDNGNPPTPATGANAWSAYTFESVNGGTTWLGTMYATGIA